MRMSFPPSLILLGLLNCSTSCTKTVQVPVHEPAVSCPLGPLPSFPRLDAIDCGPFVCVPVDKALLIWQWARDVQRWAELATVCLDANS